MEKKPTQRLLAAIAYKNGFSQTELAEWYDVQRWTISSWLKRFISIESLQHAAPMRISLVEEKYEVMLIRRDEETIHGSPAEVEFDAPALVQQYLSETNDIEYSILSIEFLE